MFRIVTKKVSSKSKTTLFKCLKEVLAIQGIKVATLKEALQKVDLKTIESQTFCGSNPLGVVVEVQQLVEEKVPYCIFFSKKIKVWRTVAHANSFIAFGDKFNHYYGKLLCLKKIKEEDTYLKLGEVINPEIERLEELTSTYYLTIDKTCNQRNITKEAPSLEGYVKIYEVMPFGFKLIYDGEKETSAE